MACMGYQPGKPADCVCGQHQGVKSWAKPKNTPQAVEICWRAHPLSGCALQSSGVRDRISPTTVGEKTKSKDYPLAALVTALSLNLVFFAKTGNVSLDGPFSDFKSSYQFCRGYSRVRTHQAKDILLSFFLLAISFVMFSYRFRWFSSPQEIFHIFAAWDTES